jgi:hypothetical protein
MIKQLKASDEDVYYLMDLITEECKNSPDGKVQLNSKISTANGMIKFEFQKWEKIAIDHFIKKYGHDEGVDIFGIAKKLLKNKLINLIANDQ